MKLVDFGFLADENIHPKVIAKLRTDGIQVSTAKQLNLEGKSDSELLRYAKDTNQIVLTHDADFGKIIYSQKMNLLEFFILDRGT